MASLKPTRSGRVTSAPETSADDQVLADPRETPGSYLMNADGTFVVLPAETLADAIVTDPAVPADQDPAETPGSYVAQDDGTFTSEAAGTVTLEGPSPAAPAPVLPAESAAAISDALDVMGQDIPSAVTAALDAPAPADDPEPAQTSGAETPVDLGGVDLAAEDPQPAAPTDQPSATSPTGDL